MFPIRDDIPSRHAPVMTLLLIALNTAIFLFAAILPRDEVRQLFYLFGIVPARFAHPAWAARVGFPADDYWPFVTSMFLHGGWLHLIGNMWTLWIFGDNVEDRMGRFRFLVFYFACGIAAGATHFLTSPSSTVPTVGASGAIAGVMGAYFVLFPRARIVMLLPLFVFPYFFEIPAFLFLAYWFVAQILTGTLALAGAADVGGVAWWAHGGGFLAGAVLFGLFLRPRERSPALRES